METSRGRFLKTADVLLLPVVAETSQTMDRYMGSVTKKEVKTCDSVRCLAIWMRIVFRCFETDEDAARYIFGGYVVTTRSLLRHRACPTSTSLSDPDYLGINGTLRLISLVASPGVTNPRINWNETLVVGR